MKRPDTAPPPPSPARVRRAYDRAAGSYDAAAVFERAVADELLARVDELQLKPRRVLDLGAGTGQVTRLLKSRFRRADVLALDLAPRLLEVARRRQGWFARVGLVCGDAHRLPLRAASIDLVYSNLMLHWATDLDGVLGELARVTVPGATVCLATLGPDTLLELRAAYAALDGLPHVNRFLDMHDVGDALARAGFRDPVLDVERYTLTYADAIGLLRDLRATGATALPNAPAGPRGLTGRDRLRRLGAAYEPFRHEGRLPATCEVIFARTVRGTARPGGAREAEIRIPLSTLKRRV